MLTDEKLTQEELEKEDNILIESIVTNKAKFVGQSLMKSDFRRRFGLFILAIRREGSILREKIAHVVLNAYDTLLVYGPEKKVRDLTKNGEFLVLGEVDAGAGLPHGRGEGEGFGDLEAGIRTCVAGALRAGEDALFLVRRLPSVPACLIPQHLY